MMKPIATPPLENRPAKSRLRLLLPAFILLSCLSPASRALPSEGTQANGRAILEQMGQVNRFWLLRPPTAVEQYAYTYHLLDREPMVQAIQTPARARNTHRQGATYYSAVHRLARDPSAAEIRQVREEDGVITLLLAFDTPFTAHCGNGIENTWRGYFSVRREMAELTLDAQRLVPLQCSLGDVTETFEEYVAVDESHYVPLRIEVVRGESMHFKWSFRLHEPGLWLFDESYTGGQRVAWIDNVKVNQQPAVLAHATAVSIARAQAEAQGAPAVTTFLAANQSWLWPPLESRRGLAYAYRQESSYRERVLFDPQGNVFVQLDSTRDAPDTITRPRLWTSDGRLIQVEAKDPLVTAPPKASGSDVDAGSAFRTDRHLQHVAMGLALDCSITRLARDPQAFWAEVSPTRDSRYTLTLHAKQDARLFVGTMLMFTSWAYMHDVGYARSEIVCDAVTHRPLTETDLDSNGNVAGEFVFDEYVQDPHGKGVAPKRITARIPHKNRDGQDQTLEMNAEFTWARPEVWMLHQVHSAFRNSDEGSTGRLEFIETQPDPWAPVQRMLDRIRQTTAMLDALRAAPNSLTVNAPLNQWTTQFLTATWSATASDSNRAHANRSDSDNASASPLIGIHRLRATRDSNQQLQIELEGVSTAKWQEYRTEWEITLLLDSHDAPLVCRTTTEVRCEAQPTPFNVSIPCPGAESLLAHDTLRILLRGRVKSLTGAYHGHGMWYRLSAE